MSVAVVVCDGIYRELSGFSVVVYPWSKYKSEIKALIGLHLFAASSSQMQWLFSRNKDVILDADG